MMEKHKDDMTAGSVHSWMNEFHDKFLTPQLEIVSNDPGKFLAWLVLLSCLLTFILGHIIYLVLFLLIYITWAYSEHLQDKVVDKEEDQNEWLLDKFFCFLQQLDNETYDLDLKAIPSDEIDSVETESETEIEKTTCSVVFENSDSLVDNSEEDTDEDEEEEVEDDDSIDSLDEEDFEFISTDDLWFTNFEIGDKKYEYEKNGLNEIINAY